MASDQPAEFITPTKANEWDVKELQTDEKPWADKNTNERVLTVALMISKVALVIMTLFLFLISLSVMGNSFKLLGGKSSGRIFRESDIFDNPVAGLVMGILTTVLVQSSSTSTSIIVTMAAGNLVTVKNAIPMIMGANIGTAVTASIVSVAHIGDKDAYRRAFAGSIAHYCFNVLTTLVVLPIECIFGLVQAIAEGIVEGLGISNETDKSNTKQDFLKLITKPVSSAILQVDKKLVNKIAAEADIDELKKLDATSIIQQKIGKSTHLFTDTPMSDETAGILMVILSLCFLSACLILLVKTLKSIFKGRAAMWISKGLNLEIKRVPFVADYILMLIGLGLTILMQSSSVTTSTLTPLVGIGLVRVDKMFPFTIGANIGTTVTGLLAALASDRMYVGMQVALSHLIFNLLGTLIWFAVPVMRKAPLGMAYLLGGLAADMKAFPPVFIMTAWVVVPGILLGLSLWHVAACAIGVAVFVILAIAIFVWYILRTKKPDLLPTKLRTDPAWMPSSLRISPDSRNVPSGTSDGSTKEGSADLGSGTAWWQAPMAWGSGYFLVMMLIVAVWNCQWANLKYPKFDGRDHAGIGAWEICSKSFEKDMPWATVPVCSSGHLEKCAAIQGCTTKGSSEVPGANSLYEKSWTACRELCPLQVWEAHCLSMGCGGSMHESQCLNVTKAVAPSFDVSYMDSSANSAFAWKAGKRCRDISEVCNNDEPLKNAGGCGAAGTVFAGIGQLLLMAYIFKRQERDMFACLLASLASCVLAWVLLLASWAIFADALSSETSCAVVDISAAGAVMGSGTFGDIVGRQGSISYSFVIAAWCLLSIVIGLESHRVVLDYRVRKQSEEGAQEQQVAIDSI